MAQVKDREAAADTGPLVIPRIAVAAREAVLWLMIAIALVLELALGSFNPSDRSYTNSGAMGPIHNLVGPTGAWVSDILLFGLGATAYLLPVFLGYAGWLGFRRKKPIKPLALSLRLASMVVALFSLSAVLVLVASPLAQGWLPAGIGGILGDVFAAPFVDGLGVAGGTLILLAVMAAGVTLATGLSWLALIDRVGSWAMRLVEYLMLRRQHLNERRAAKRGRVARSEARAREAARRQSRAKPRIELAAGHVQPSSKAERERQRNLFPIAAKGQANGSPPLELLDPPPQRARGYDDKTLEAMSRQLELKLRDFGIEAEVVAVHAGPVITRFEIQPAPGIKVSQITNLSKDLARSLSTVSVRVVEVIPGKSVIGIEVPNESRELVTLGEILRSGDYDRANSRLTLALGKDISGHPVVTDLSRMPHLLIAGTTGSGKSVALNAMLLSLLYKANAEEVRLLLIDPKMLELSVYEGIPHLLSPVVTDMSEAATALRWCVIEMDRRYRRIAEMKVRNLASYNRKVRELSSRGEKVADPLAEPDENGERAPLEPMPMIVVVIDELADLMLVVGKKVEELIARLAQKARAAGIHLVVATQRPSVDVITGLIKANIPARIAFQVSSRIDSRTIIDQSGADALLGNGDMLFLPPGTSLVNRVHGAFVEDAEVHRVVEWLRENGSPDYVEEVLQATESNSEVMGGSNWSDTEESDPLYDEAVRLVTETRRASISAVQRRLRVGYNRAARLVEQMERVGIVGPLQSNGSREVLAPPPPE